MMYWLHIARAIDRVTLHRDRCSEVPSGVSSSDYWQGGWFDYPDKERALAAMEQAGTSDERKCALCIDGGGMGGCFSPPTVCIRRS